MTQKAAKKRSVAEDQDWDHECNQAELDRPRLRHKRAQTWVAARICRPPYAGLQTEPDDMSAQTGLD